MDTFFSLGLFVWLVLFLAGKRQLKRLRDNTIELVLSDIGLAQNQDENLTVEKYYEQLLPKWNQVVSRSAWFVPHRCELWPMPATPGYLRTRMNFTPAWLGAFLQLNEIKLSCSPELESQIKHIVQMKIGKI